MNVSADENEEYKGLSPALKLAAKAGEEWMRKRKMISQYSSNRKHIEFAKNLFLSWDDDGSGILDAEELVKPLISLGLSSDSKFATKLL